MLNAPTSRMTKPAVISRAPHGIKRVILQDLYRLRSCQNMKICKGDDFFDLYFVCHACTTPEARYNAAKIGGAILFGW